MKDLIHLHRRAADQRGRLATIHYAIGGWICRNFNAFLVAYSIFSIGFFLIVIITEYPNNGQ